MNKKLIELTSSDEIQNANLIFDTSNIEIDSNAECEYFEFKFLNPNEKYDILSVLTQLFILRYNVLCFTTVKQMPLSLQWHFDLLKSLDDDDRSTLYKLNIIDIDNSEFSDFDKQNFNPAIIIVTEKFNEELYYIIKDIYKKYQTRNLVLFLS